MHHATSLALEKSIRNPDDATLKQEAMAHLSVSLRLGDITLTEHIQYYAILHGRTHSEQQSARPNSASAEHVRPALRIADTDDDATVLQTPAPATSEISGVPEPRVA